VFLTKYHAKQNILCLTKHHAMTYGVAKVYLHAFLTSALNGGECSASRSGHLNPRVNAPVAHWIGV